MESPTPVPRYIPQNSNSSSGCKEVEVLEISPPSTRASKPKSSKQKEVTFQEIIDVDMEEDCDEVVFINGGVGPSAKGKEVSSDYSVGLNSLANDEYDIDTLTATNDAASSHGSTNIDDFNSNLFYGEEEELIDTYYNDILYDDYGSLESHFDHIAIPPGVEAPFPWLSSSPRNNMNLPTTSTYTSLKPQFEGINLSPGLNSSHSSQAMKLTQISDLSTSWSSSMTDIHMKGNLPSKWMESGWGQKKSAASSVTANPNSQPSRGSLKSAKEPFHSLKSKRKARTSHTIYSGHYNSFPPAPMYPIVNGGGSYPTPNMPTYPFGVGSFMPVGQDLPLNMLEPSLGPSGLMNGSTFHSWAEDPANNVKSIGNSLPTRVDQKNVEDILRNFDTFKKFDTVEDCSDHHYSKNGSSAKQPPKNWAKRVQEEWKILEKDLPDEIFVRVYESRMDLLRAVIIGAEGTPYHDGLFFFDVYFPSSYPNIPPHVHYHSGGLRINPNLYNCGKVCLSLLNTWSGSQKEKWIPGVSTMLQVLVSIQGLILNAKPYFNEPGYANMSGSVSGEKRSLEYNERTFMYNLQTMGYSIRRPPKYFEDFVIGHFCKHGRDILVSCKSYLEGAQVGCLVKGGVQDVDEGDKSCSQQFKNNLAGFITTLVNSFLLIGAKDCQEFLSLAQKGNGQATVAPKARHFFI